MNDELDLETDEVTDMKESKAERFSRVVNPRLMQAVTRIRMVSRMFDGANSYNYEWTVEQAEKLVDILQAEVDEVKRLAMREPEKKETLPFI